LYHYQGEAAAVTATMWKPTGSGDWHAIELAMTSKA
jgi:hypothetical protein